VPSPTYVEIGTVLGRIWMTNYDRILRVAAVPEERVPAATLLPHIIEGEVGCPVIDTGIHREYLRTGLPPV
jgi:hypothetical protein